MNEYSKFGPIYPSQRRLIAAEYMIILFYDSFKRPLFRGCLKCIKCDCFATSQSSYVKYILMPRHKDKKRDLFFLWIVAQAYFYATEMVSFLTFSHIWWNRMLLHYRGSWRGIYLMQPAHLHLLSTEVTVVIITCNLKKAAQPQTSFCAYIEAST